MQEILQLIQGDGDISRDEIARNLGLTRADVDAQIAALVADGVIIGRPWLLNEEKIEGSGVTATIEVKITPERDGGFDRIAKRIAKFSQVETCALYSGGYDLIVQVRGKDLVAVARFVSEKLATIEGVISTQSHFQLKTYKENGIIFERDEEQERLPVTP